MVRPGGTARAAKKWNMTSKESAAIQEFGSKIDGVVYIDRPGVYAVIENRDKQIAVLETSIGYFLPGGGIDAGETEVEALKRELIEELGYQISVIAKIGAAVEYLKASREEKYYHIRSTFYEVQLDSKIGEGIEKDHRFVWLSQEEALRLLTRQSQVWAVQSRIKGSAEEVGC
jgi:8-oxo-dGTP diphosphatase